ncbi:hypothetical protein T492DRAFT_416846 [Pavlovales sp. CCMP2436]|nr:hypothetical protein T492DRAFT_416846 [Pavlovales sp. CCMP2436]
MPAHGSMSTQATRAARAVIVQSAATTWSPPTGYTPASMEAKPTHRLVRVTEVNLPALVVPRVKGPNRNPSTLGSFGAPPYFLLLPLSMLAPVRAVAAPTSAVPPSTTPVAASTPPPPPLPPPIASTAPASAGASFIFPAVDDDGDDGDDGGDGGDGDDGEPLTEHEIARLQAL